jgi:hypothetical protein
MPHILIVAARPEHAAVYRKALMRRNASCETAQDIADMHRRVLRTPFNGLMLDVYTTMKASQEEKTIIQETTEIYPTMRVRWDVGAHQIRGLVLGQTLDHEDPLGDFLDRFCRCRPARICRGSKRHAIHCNVLLSRRADFRANDVEKTVTLDISEGGCFLITSETWHDGETAWLRFVDLCDAAPVQAEVRRHLPWGQGLSIPGIGVKFQNPCPALMEGLHSRLTAK